MTSALPTPIELFGVKIHPTTQVELVNTLVTWARTGRRNRVYNVNAHALNLAWERPQFRESLNGADLIFCDGYGVKLAARLHGLNLPDRMSPPDWIDSFFGRLRPEDSVFLLGDEDVVVRACAIEIKQKHPTVSIAGWHSGFFDVEGENNDSVVAAIAASRARVLLVGMGMPRQEYWIDHNIEGLDVRIALPVGALFRWYSGVERRAPQVLARHGLEWLWRLAHHPVLLFNRYVIGNFKFLARVLGASRNH